MDCKDDSRRLDDVGTAIVGKYIRSAHHISEV